MLLKGNYIYKSPLCIVIVSFNSISPEKRNGQVKQMLEIRLILIIIKDETKKIGLALVVG